MGAPSGNAAGGIETHLANLWAAMLPQSIVRMDSDFFELGGNSLLAVRMLVAVEQEYAAIIDVAQFFALPRLSTLVALVKQERQDPTETPAPDAERR